jgi:tetratricopeptide (TPR) repeat protein
MPDRISKVMVSSTSIDLPLHRSEVLHACARQQMLPLMMEHLPASGADAIATSMKLIDDADIFVGIIAHRYGYVPEGNEYSITEMEYNRAVERGIPRLIFLIDKNHPITIGDVETGEKALKLDAFKKRLLVENFVNFFASPADLRAHVINSLSQYRTRDIAALHYVTDIPSLPESYVAHPYTLLQMRDLVGRQMELNRLSDWVAGPASDIYQARILSIVAVGGNGKSALTWEWFNNIAPYKMRPLAGRMWWSFYESDATFENFVIRALAYVTARSRVDIERNTRPGEREELLLGVLDRAPFLIALDGMERILTAYTRMDANRLDSNLDQETGNVVAAASALVESPARSFGGQHPLRKSADPRVGVFLRKLARVRSTRVLISTRLYPADLESVGGYPLPGCYAYFLQGLNDEDALRLWHAFGVSGSRDDLLLMFRAFENHPLLIQALASEVAHYRRAPGNFETWRANHREFNPFSLPLVQVKSHVLEFALRGLDGSSKRILQTVAAFRMPGTYDTLAALLVGRTEPFGRENELDSALAELEDRGLLGWDTRANRYHLHPVVRGVVWIGMDERTKLYTYNKLQSHFASIPEVPRDKVNSLDDITPSIELYCTLIGLKEYDEACDLFYTRLADITLFRLAASRQRADLLEMLFPENVEWSHLHQPGAYTYALHALAVSYDTSGQPGRAVPLYRRTNELNEQQGYLKGKSVGLNNLALAMLQIGRLRDAHAAALQALAMSRELRNRFQETVSLRILGLLFGARGVEGEARSALGRSLAISAFENQAQSLGLARAYCSQIELWFGHFTTARQEADTAWEFAGTMKFERDFVRAARMQGVASLCCGQLAPADERLHQALTRARAVNLVEEELPAMIALAELRRRQRFPSVARELLEDVWESASRGPYTLFEADAYNLLARIECEEGNYAAAAEAYARSYRLAWCDGPPFSYQPALREARKCLGELGVRRLPDLPPYDESKFGPMPVVPIDLPTFA